MFRPGDEIGDKVPTLGPGDVHGHADPMAGKFGGAAAAHVGIGIRRADHDLLDPCVQNGPGAWRGLAIVIAGFEGHPERTLRGIDAIVAGVGNDLHFGMRTAEDLVPAAGNDNAVPREHGADARVWRRGPLPMERERDGLVHRRELRRGGCRGHPAFRQDIDGTVVVKTRIQVSPRLP